MFFVKLQGCRKGCVRENLHVGLRIRAMHEANTALLDILVDKSVIIPSFQNRTRTFLNNGL